MKALFIQPGREEKVNDKHAVGQPARLLRGGPRPGRCPQCPAQRKHGDLELNLGFEVVVLPLGWALPNLRQNLRV